MTPAAILLCTTLVTNTAEGTFVSRDCKSVEPPIVKAETTSFENFPLRQLNDVAIKQVEPSAQTEEIAMAEPSLAVKPARNTMATPQKLSAPIVKTVGHKRIWVAINQPRQPRQWHHSASSKIRVIPTASKTTHPVSFWDKLMGLSQPKAKSPVADETNDLSINLFGLKL